MDAVQLRVLAAARALADRSTNWRFRVRDVVRALPDLNPGTVRTHVASRCCVNAPSHHQSRHPYFRSVGRGEYRLEPQYRVRRTRRPAITPWPDRWFEMYGTGVDVTQLIEALKLTPTERLENMRRSALALEDLKRNVSWPTR
jgi:hypothetical protein